jgi:hypothetical protein
LIIDEAIYRLLREALTHQRHMIDLKVVSEREIMNAHFNFTYAAYAKQYGDALKELLSALPEGVHLEGYEPEEIEREAKDSTAGYAPLHNYEIRAKGRLSGPAKEVIDFYDKIEHNEWIELGEIELE